MKTVSVKTKLVIFLLALAVSLYFFDRDTAFLFAALISIVSAAILDSIAGIIKNRVVILTESSLISGLIIGFVLASDSPWWVIFLTCLFAITSKHIIRINKRHIFNPAAFGIFLSSLVLGANTQWKGTYLWFILIPFGIYFTYKIRRIELLAAYLITSLTLFGSQAIVNKVPLSAIFGYLSYFYICIMLIEPKTTPNNFWGKVIFGVATAILIFVFTQMGARFDVELAALLITNLFVGFLNRIPEGRKK